MQLALNIERFAKPVVTETHLMTFVTNFLYFMQKKIKTNLHNSIDDLILAVEGYYSHVVELETSQASELLESMKRVISLLNKIDEDLNDKNYFEDPQLKEKYKYMLKSIYKMESILHKSVYKNTPVEKTDETILKGISNMNRRNMSKLLSI